jgi:hypothetical protein
MRLVLALLWLLGAAGLFIYEAVTDTRPFRIRGMDNVSAAWLMLLVGVYLLARWYSARMSRADAQADRLVREARERQSRTRERSTPEFDPTFDFTNKPGSPPQPRGPTEIPPSNN